MSQKNTYTAADFERYHSGKMTEAEMHAIEKAAMEDPFLADALEGYAFTSTPAKDIAELKDKLSTKKKKKNIFLLISTQNTWLRIAALFILIAGISYLAYQVNFNKEDNTLATRQDEFKKTSEQPVIPATDSSLPNEQKDLASNSPLTKSKERLINKGNTLPGQDMKISSDMDERTYSSPVPESQPKPVMESAKKDYVVTVPEKNILKGKIVDSMGNAIRYATIRDKAKKVSTTSDSLGRFVLAVNDTSAIATISVPGYRTKEKQLSDKSEPVIVMQHDSKPMDDVVVTANGGKRSERSASYETMKNKQAPKKSENSTSQPVNELQEFNEYVQKNKNIPTDNEGKNYKGKVMLSFEINKRGNPKKIKVEQSLCKPCDKEAIRLLEHGPKWKYINVNRQTVTIDF